MAESTTPGYVQYELEEHRDYFSPELNEAVQQCDEAEASASSTYNRDTRNTMAGDLSAAVHNDRFQRPLVILSSAYLNPLNRPLGDDNALIGASATSMFRNDWDSNETCYPENPSHPQFSFDPRSAWPHDSQMLEHNTAQHQNSSRSVSVSSGVYPWQNSTQQAGFEPWTHLNAKYGTAQLDGTTYYSSNASTMEHRSSGEPSSMSFTGATTTSRTSENYDHGGLADSGLTEHPSWYQAEYSFAVGDNTLSQMAQPGSLHVVTGVHSRSSSIQPCVQDNGDSGSLPLVGDTQNRHSLVCEFPGCMQKFTGTHRRGTMHRHMRLKHREHETGPEKNFPCRAAGCRKTFKRQDARLKHHRGKHPELGLAAPTPRRGR